MIKIQIRRLLIVVIYALWGVTAVTFIYTLIQWILADPGDFEPLNVLATVALSVLAWCLTRLRQSIPDMPPGSRKDYDFFSARYKRDRKTMLSKVRLFWIEGVLEKSLHNAVLLELNLRHKPEAVQHFWNFSLQAPEQLQHTLPPGIKIIDLFERFGRSLLILGEPGSGKTITLLELARTLIAQAEQDETYPIPVILNLSSWAAKQLPLANWIVEELSLEYQIPGWVGRAWVDHDELLLLLDGLDEVKAEFREACVKAINEFGSEHRVDCVICSRVADYERLAECLQLSSAVLIEPLTRNQIDTYLSAGGEQLAAARIAVNTDALLQELARSPLNLNIIALVYRGKASIDLAPGTLSERRRQLFAAYLYQMYQHRHPTDHYPPNQVVHRLAWLAHQMIQHSQMIFHIERLQPDWLPTGRLQRTYQLVVRGGEAVMLGIFDGIFFGMGMGLFMGLVGGWKMGLAQAILWALAFGLIIGLGTLTVPYKPEIRLVERVSWSWEKAKNGFFLGVFGGLLFGVTIGVISWVISTLFLGLSSGVLFGFRTGLAAWLILGLIFGQSSWKNDGLVYQEIEIRTKPNQGIRHSAQNALRIGFFSGVFDGLYIGILGGLAIGLLGEVNGEWLRNISKGLLDNGLTDGLYFALGVGGIYFGLSGGLHGWLNGGGRTVIRHYVLRFLLSRNKFLPSNLIDFLDDADVHIILRKVGGGYIFVHRMLQEYLSSLEPKSNNR